MKYIFIFFCADFHILMTIKILYLTKMIKDSEMSASQK